ncbi:MAG: DNA polymerase I [Phycisphaerales bacterium]|nr:DNA polymerase I [Phycisphaerales bacterium]
MPDGEVLYLIDGYSQFFRAYYARRPYSTSSVTREPTKMVAGFCDILMNLLEAGSPTHLAVALDVSGDTGTFRSGIDPDYKANREEAPDDFGPQVDRCLEVIEALQIPLLGVEGAEADDVIATIARRARESRPDMQVRVISADKDLTQIVGDHVEIFDPQRDVVRTPSDVFKTEGVEAHHVVDMLCLMGDSVDNIPGVPGIGPKTAAKLILQYGSIEGIYQHIDEIKGKRRENLEGAQDRLLLNRELVVLKDDLDFDFDWDDAAVDLANLPLEPPSTLFKTLDFRRTPAQLEKLIRAAAGPTAGGDDAAAAGDDTDAGTLWGGLEAKTVRPADSSADYTAVLDADALTEVVAAIVEADMVAIDTETTGLDPMQDSLCGVCVAVTPGRGWYIPVRSPEPETHLDEATVIAALKPVLESPDLHMVAHNAKFDLKVLRRAGISVIGTVTDTMVMSYVADGARSSHRMDALALGLLGLDCISITSLIGTGKNQASFDTVALESAVPYAAEDADITLRLVEPLRSQVDEQNLGALFDDLENPLVPVLADMEFTGVRVDPDELDRQRDRLVGRLEALRAEIAEAAPGPLNPDSPKQLAAALFNAEDDEVPGLGLTVIKRRKTGPSTDVEVLEKLDADPEVTTPLPGLVLEYRQLAKLVGTYLVALKACINPETGRVHTRFNQIATATGRLSSSDPNLQNIPIRTDLGRAIRKAFVAREGCVLVTADYSQVELRVLAHLSQDKGLITAFEAGEDIHRAVAAEVFGVSPDAVTSEQRGAAKMVNFGIVYGITPFGLSRRLGEGTSVARASQIIGDYKARFPGIERFLDDCVAQAQDTGFVETMAGRRREIPTIDSSNGQERALAERHAINSVVQGSAADLIKLAMLNLHARLPDLHAEARLVLQVHDELVIEVPEAVADAARDLLVSSMEGAMDLRVPLVVDAAVSQDWYDAK